MRTLNAPSLATWPQRLLTATLGAVLCWGAGHPAQAQVMRCTDPVSGKVTYTDGECSRGATATEIERRKSEEELAQDRAREREALRAKAERREQDLEQRRLNAEAQAAESASQQRKRPARIDYANSAACQQSRERYQTAADSPTDRAIGSLTQLEAARRQMEMDCLGPEAYARLEGSRPAPSTTVVNDDYWGRYPYGHPRPPVRPEPPRPAPNIVRCDVFKCVDAQGYSHPRGQLGETPRRP